VSVAIWLARISVIDFFTSADLLPPVFSTYSRVVISRGNLAFDLQVRAFGESGGVVGKPSPADDAMPGGFRLPLSGLAVLPAPLRCQ
jgi:hypothetical protein